MTKILPAVVGLALVGAQGCAFQDDGPACIEDCDLCQDDRCPEDRCGLMVEIASDCDGVADPVEVAVDECVEALDFAPGQSHRLCATVLKQKTRVVRAASDKWVWQKTVTCEPAQAGRIVVLTLHCESP